MIADFTKLFKKPTNESNTPPDNKGPRSLITNINPEDPQNQGKIYILKLIFRNIDPDI